MAKERRTIGSGMTAREVTRYSDEDTGPALHVWSRQWNADLSEGGGLFGSQVVKQERACRRILAGAGDGPFERDSLQDYAKRILYGIDQTKKQILHGDADQAAREAVHVGRLITEMNMKLRWEDHALRGAKNASTLKATANLGNQKRHGKAQTRHSKWQTRANKKWAQNPLLSTAAVANLVARECGDPPRTIRRNIKKPRA
jgi:hypothetical protein